jgi:hypothetical protein
VGLSGGADSVVLAEALHRLGAKPVILHFNHRWRGKSAEADARWVQAWARARKSESGDGTGGQGGSDGRRGERGRPDGNFSKRQ